MSRSDGAREVGDGLYGRPARGRRPRPRDAGDATHPDTCARVRGVSASRNPKRRRPGPLGGVALLLALTSGLELAAPASVEAATLRIRTGTMLKAWTEPDSGGPVLTGRLRDDQGRPLEERRLRIELGDRPEETVRTDREGRFSFGPIRLSGRESLPWTVRFGGGERYAAARAEGLLDGRRRPTRLELRVDPERTGLYGEDLVARVRLRSGPRPLTGVRVRVRVADGPELLGVTNERGRASFRLHPWTLGRAGAFPIRASWRGDRRHAAASDTARVVLQRPTRLTLRARRQGDARRGRYLFSGRLSDDTGPLAGKPVALVVRPADETSRDAARPTSTGQPDEARTRLVAHTDARGIFLASVPARRLAPKRADEVTVRAVHPSTDETLRSTRSATARVGLVAPEGMPLHWYAASIALGLGVLLLAWATQLRAWERLLRLLPRRGRGGDDHAADREPPLVVSPAEGPDRRRDHLGGRVVDAHTGELVAGGSVRLEHATEPPRTAGLDGGGGFELGPLSSGAWTLLLQAPGYLARRGHVVLPHDGSLDGATFALASARGRVRDLFDEGLERRHLAFQWGRQTPAEALRRAEEAEVADRETLEALRKLVEDAWFGPEQPTPEQVQRAEALLERLGSPDDAEVPP